MAQVIVNSKKNIACFYDFSVDGGAVGVIDFPKFFPNFASVDSVSITGTALASASLCTLSFGTNSDAEQFVDNVPFQAFNVIAPTTQGLFFSLQDCFSGGLTGEFPRMTINTAPLTAGTILFIINYNEIRL